MMRAFLACFGLLAIGMGAPVLAQDPDQEPTKSNAPADPQTEKSLERQEILNRQFREFESALLRLSQRLERSNKPEDRERAANLKKALELASKENTDTKFDRLVTILRSSKALNMREIEQAMEQSQLLEQDIRDILALLLADNRDAEIKRETARLSALLKRIEKALRDEKVERAETEAGQKGKEALAKEQKRLANDTAEIAKDMGKNAKGDQAKGSNGQGGEGQGQQGKGGGKGSGKGGQGGSGSEGEPKEGSPKEGQSPDSPQQQDTPGRKHVQDANEYQRQAEQNIRQEKKNEASSNQGKSIEELEKARKKLEELLRQLREEEMERMLAALQARCERMLAMQIAIFESSKRLNDTIQGHPDKRAERIDEQKSLHLSDQEQAIVKDANAAIAVLEAEGSAVAFPEAFVQVRDDATHVARRLGKVDVGTVTQVIEQDIIATLKDMIEALKRKREANKSQGQSGGGQSQSALINLLAELKMIRAMQLRLNNRTLTYARQYDGEQAKDPDIRKELENLADREQKIFEALNDIARGKNK